MKAIRGTIVGVQTDAGLTGCEFLFSATDFNSYVTVNTADGAPQRVHGRMAASKSPGLGIQPKMDLLGKRVVEVA